MRGPAYSGGFDTEGRALKVATQRLTKTLGGIEGAAATCGKGKSTVARWGDRNDTEHWINLRDLAELEAHAPAPLVTQALCRIAGGVFVALPTTALAGEIPSDGALADHMLQAMDDVGQLAGHLRTSLADGRVDRGEARKLRELITELLQGAVRFDQVLAGLDDTS